MKTRLFFIFICLQGFLLLITPELLVSQTKKLPPAKSSKTGVYYKQWKQVDSLSNVGLPKSAIEIVNRIYSQSKKEGNKPEYIKSVIYRFKLQSDFQEDVLIKTIQDLKTEIKTSSEPVQQILNSILAEVYWKYWQNNVYRFQDRTQVLDNKVDSIQTWDLTTISDHITSTYLLSLNNPGLLKNIPISEYKDIVSFPGQQDKRKATESATSPFRPTLFDFLAWRSLDFFMSNDTPLKVSASAFQVDDPRYFSLPANFIKMTIKLVPPTTSSMEYQAITIFRDLTAFHFTDKNPQALIDEELQRFSYLLRIAVIEKKDSLYLLSLKQFEKDYNYSPWSTDISYAIANFLFTTGQDYRPLESEKHKWDIKSSLGFCENAIGRFPESEGANRCRTLEENIRQSSMEIITEYAVNPDKPSLGLLDFRNIPTVWFRLIRADPESTQNKISTMTQQEILKYYTSLTVVKSWSLVLPTDGDFQRHTTEISIPAVPKGYYILLCSSDKDFGSDKQAICFSSFYSTRISYISQRTPTGGYDFYILDRESGDPLQNVAAEAWTKLYNYSSRRYENRKLNDYVTDNNGSFSIPPLNTGTNYSGFFIKLKLKDDLFITDNLYQYPINEKPEKPALHTYFFTDRSIYRPGQTIYFKGIILEQTGDDRKIKTDLKTTVTFTDANYQKISEQTFVTNEYGSFNGMFIAPQGVLLGQMTISNGSGSVSLSVEEYKRPTFSVTFNALEGNYRLNDSITLKGKAAGYAGNDIGGATVKYRVVRTARFPYQNRGWSMPFPVSPEIEITNGITQSMPDGSFIIPFKALPDRTIPRSNNPVFDFVIYSDVTDINGETQSNQATISAGYISLMIGSDLPDKLNITKDSIIRVITKNVNGKSTPASVRVIITRLRQPDRLFRNRLWKRADLNITERKDFYLDFPFDVYDDEDNPEKWESETSTETTVNTRVDSMINLRHFPSVVPLKPGCYRLTLNAKDPFGERVETKTYFSVYDPSSKELSINTMNWFVPLKTSGEPGDKALFLIGSKDENINVIYEIWAHDSLQSRQWLKLGNRQMLVEIPVKEEYRGNCAVNFVFIRHNRAYQNSQVITVPYPSKKLGIILESFRDKLYPGQNEEWKITIKDPAGKGTDAEFLTAMYDESLDLFSPNSWNFSLTRKYFSSNPWEIANSFKIAAGTYNPLHPVAGGYAIREYPQLNWFGFNYFNASRWGSGILKMSDKNMDRKESLIQPGGGIEPVVEMSVVPPSDINAEIKQQPAKTPLPVMPPYQVRRDFRETAFFYPALLTDKNGTVSLKFTVPESLTKWKLLGLAHTRQLEWGQVEKEVITQKDLMVFPNAPRFVRQGDTVIFSAKVVNLSTEALSGEINLEFTDAITQQPVEIIQDSSGIRHPASGIRSRKSGISDSLRHPASFTIDAGKSENFEWKLIIPVDPQLNVIQYHIAAKAVNFTDAEENSIPVLTNRMLVTESLPLPVRGKGSFDFSFDKLSQTAGLNKKDNTLKNYKLTLEFASNPAWYAIQALPLLDEPAFPNADNIFNAFYANSIASFIANSNPKIKKVFDSWKNITPEALLSNLEKNQQLKSAILQETPWVMEAKSETQRKQRVALLFDLNTLSGRLSQNLDKLRKMQSPNGGWPWFEGMQESRYITQNIVTGLGHLDHLGIKNIREDKILWDMINKAVQFLDGELVKDYENVKKLYPGKMDEDHLSSTQIQYLYARSYFSDLRMPDAGCQIAFDYFKGQAIHYWLQKDIYSQGMIALALNRLGTKDIPLLILKSLSEKALHSTEFGMYWAVQSGFELYQAPVETQSLLIEAYQEIIADKNAVEEMKIWLLKQKQTQDWKTSRATAEACYALLLRGTDLLAATPDVKIVVGKTKIDAAKLEDTKAEAGTGYFQVSWSGAEITPDMGKVKIAKSDEGVAWGALYWQYFEDLDKVTPAQTPLKIDKKLFLEKNTSTGPALQEITNNNKLTTLPPHHLTSSLNVGDKIKVRIILTVDRNLEFVHLKDMRASSFEPSLTTSPPHHLTSSSGEGLSGYRYQDGIGYYQSTTDVATNFFFDYLPKGTYVFEYPLVVNAAGNYSNGISTVQCMYAPEFAAHSSGIRVVVK